LQLASKVSVNDRAILMRRLRTKGRQAMAASILEWEDVLASLYNDPTTGKPKGRKTKKQPPPPPPPTSPVATHRLSGRSLLAITYTTPTPTSSPYADVDDLLRTDSSDESVQLRRRSVPRSLSSGHDEESSPVSQRSTPTRVHVQLDDNVVLSDLEDVADKTSPKTGASLLVTFYPALKGPVSTSTPAETILENNDVSNSQLSGIILEEISTTQFMLKRRCEPAPSRTTRSQSTSPPTKKARAEPPPTTALSLGDILDLMRTRLGATSGYAAAKIEKSPLPTVWRPASGKLLATEVLLEHHGETPVKRPRPVSYYKYNLMTFCKI